MALQPQRLNIPIAGGLTQDETPEYLDPPALYQVDNFYHKTRTSLVKRNGYDAHAIIVDSRATTRDMTTPLYNHGDAPIDRFIQTGSSCTFAARGYLWTYDPLQYAGATTLNPQPNSVRHGEIPDLQIKRTTVVSIDGASTDTTYIKDTASAAISNTQCVAYLVVNGSYIDWRAKIIDAITGVTLSDYLIMHSAHILMRPCVAAYNGGYIVTVLNFDQAQIYAYRYSFTSAQWNVATWPSTVHFNNQDFIPNFYDMCGTNSNSVIVGAVSTHAFFIVDSGGSFLPFRQA